MGILDDLLAGGQRQKQYKDFVNRYEQGDPSEGYSDQEVLKRYGEVSHAVPPDQYAQAAQEALSKLSPEERAEFLKMLQERAAARGVKLPGKAAPDPKDLGRVLTDLHEKPGQLRGMLGGAAAQPQAQGSNPISRSLPRGVDAGGLDESWRQQPGTPVYIKDFDAEGVRRALSQASKDRTQEWRATRNSPPPAREPDRR